MAISGSTILKSALTQWTRNWLIDLMGTFEMSGKRPHTTQNLITNQAIDLAIGKLSKM